MLPELELNTQEITHHRFWGRLYKEAILLRLFVRPYSTPPRRESSQNPSQPCQSCEFTYLSYASRYRRVSVSVFESEPTLNATTFRFRKAGYQAIDRICDFYSNLERRKAASQVEPGYLRKALPGQSRQLDPVRSTTPLTLRRSCS